MMADLPDQDLVDAVERRMARQRLINFLIPLGVLAYLVYAHFAFDVNGLLQRANPERGAILLRDFVSFKTHVTRDNRSGEIAVAIEGRRTSTYETPPDWVEIDGTTGAADLGRGHSVVFYEDHTVFTVADYGDVTLRLNGRVVEVTFPDGEVPDWASVSRTRADLTVPGARVILTPRELQAHRRFWGWEEFFFTIDNPLHDLGPIGFVQAMAGPRITPEMSNPAFAWESFFGNTNWQHGRVARAMGATVVMAFCGTLVAALVALPLSFVAASTFSPTVPLGPRRIRPLRFLVRRVFDLLRGVDALIWTLILLRGPGPGPLTGTVAIAITDTGTLGKLFSEALENVDDKQIEGVRSTGAGPVQRSTFGVIPQVVPVFVSQTLYMLESNARSATVIGALVDAGIGLLLVLAIQNQADWEKVLYYVVLIVLMVVVIDRISGFLRDRLIKGREMPVLAA